MSGGLAQSSGLNSFFTDDEYDVVSGAKLIEPGLSDFQKGKMRVLDILFCEGGCINGLGIISKLPLNERRHKIITHWASVSELSFPKEKP